MKFCEIPESRITLSLKYHASCVFFSFIVLSEKEARIKGEENCAVLKRAMTQKHSGWSRIIGNANPNPNRARKTNGKARNPRKVESGSRNEGFSALSFFDASMRAMNADEGDGEEEEEEGDGERGREEKH